MLSEKFSSQDPHLADLDLANQGVVWKYSQRALMLDRVSGYQKVKGR
jgi:hypothetical protein